MAALFGVVWGVYVGVDLGLEGLGDAADSSSAEFGDEELIVDGAGVPCYFGVWDLGVEGESGDVLEPVFTGWHFWRGPFVVGEEELRR